MSSLLICQKVGDDLKAFCSTLPSIFFLDGGHHEEMELQSTQSKAKAGLLNHFMLLKLNVFLSLVQGWMFVGN